MTRRRSDLLNELLSSILRVPACWNAGARRSLVVVWRVKRPDASLSQLRRCRLKRSVGVPQGQILPSMIGSPRRSPAVRMKSTSDSSVPRFTDGRTCSRHSESGSVAAVSRTESTSESAILRRRSARLRCQNGQNGPFCLLCPIIVIRNLAVRLDEFPQNF